METLFKLISGLCSSLAALFCPIAPLVGAVTLFIGVDFLTGIVASRAEAKREGRQWWFESRRAWRTVLKLGFVIIAIVLAHVLDSCLAELLTINLAKLFTGFVCGVELWSFLENASAISHSPHLAWLGRWVKRRVEREVENE